MFLRRLCNLFLRQLQQRNAALISALSFAASPWDTPIVLSDFYATYMRVGNVRASSVGQGAQWTGKPCHVLEAGRRVQTKNSTKKQIFYLRHLIDHRQMHLPHALFFISGLQL